MTPEITVTYCGSISSMDGALEPILHGRWRRSSSDECRVGPFDAGRPAHGLNQSDRQGGRLLNPMR